MAREIYNEQFQKIQHTVYPGEYAYSAEGLIHTVTGDCCLLCLHDPVTHSAGLCSFLLPVTGSKNDDSDLIRQSVAFIELVMADFVKAGAHRSRLTAKIFGLGAISISSDVAAANSAFIERYLANEHIRLLTSSTGSGTFRELFLIPETGCAYLRHFDKTDELSHWSQVEGEYIRSIHSSFTTRFVLFSQGYSLP